MLVFPLPWLRRLGQLLKYEQICEIALWQRETQNVNLDVDIFFFNQTYLLLCTQKPHISKNERPS